MCRCLKIELGFSRLAVHGDSDTHRASIVHFIGEFSRFEHLDDLAHNLLGVVLYKTHVSGHDVEPKLIYHLVQFANPTLVGGDLRPEAGEIHLWVPARVRPTAQQIYYFFFAERSAVH